ncbi:DUF502 domain-containing protein [Desulfurivibrio dismutans]|uniref:DUF502 domain-containing protein n=1 Tax=Desulfurivibrio dismutans TaxID=1398908 RepID=UPI0023DBFC43|nr:DUF502 domain-containing protein [Desulfurivibrio alkaliphilus]MDF1614426.1 DUF502 domain-containing protein [Desulfurivibrio alkaliphilus]
MRERSMKIIGKYFLHGLLFLVPVLVTLYVLYLVFTSIDGIFPFTVPGAGFMLTIGLILAVGFVTSNLLGRGLVQLVDRLFARLPLVALLYTSIKDLVNAFVGDKKSFNRPVEVFLDADGQIRVLGFITREDLAGFGLVDSCAVYLPQSYNFAGNLIIVPRQRVRPLAADPAEVMKLIVSGGVSSKPTDMGRFKETD